MPKEAQLWKLLRDNVPSVHWQRIETGMTGAGVPDVNGCLNGKEVWIELKYVVGRKLGLRPMQISWLASRTRHCGDCYVLARKNDCIKLWLVVDLEQLKSLTWDSPAVIELQSPFQWALLLEMFPGKS